MRIETGTPVATDSDFFDWEFADENRFFIAPELAIAGGWALQVPALRRVPEPPVRLISPPRSAS